MSTGKIELSVGAVKYVDPNEIITEEEYNYIKNKVPELDRRVGVTEDEIEEINSSLDNIKNEFNRKEFFINATNGDNITDLLNNTLLNVPPFSRIVIPFGTYHVEQIIIPENKAGLEICGVGKSLTIIECSHTTTLVSVKSEFITFRDMSIKGNISNIDTTGFSDDRPESRDDFDFTLVNCDFQYMKNLIIAKGHSITVDSCLFANWFQGGAIIESSYSYLNEIKDGHRTYIVNNNRFHYINSCIFKNLGACQNSIDGIKITSNYIEGSLKYFEGYAKNLIIKNNNHIQYAFSVKHLDDIVKLYGGENIEIDFNFSVLKGNVGVKNLVTCNGEVNNLKIIGLANGVYGKVVQLAGGGNNIQIDVNVISDNATITNYVHLTSFETSSNYKNVDVRGCIYSNNPNFVGLLKHPNTTVNNFKWDFLIDGQFSLYTSGLTMAHCVSQPSIQGFYTGDGETKTINIKYTPKTIEIIETNVENGYHNVTITGVTTGRGILSETNGFTISGDANKSGSRYIYKIT